MGKGDKRTKRGKIVISTYGKSRPRKAKNVIAQKKASEIAVTETVKEG